MTRYDWLVPFRAVSLQMLFPRWSMMFLPLIPSSSQPTPAGPLTAARRVRGSQDCLLPPSPHQA